MKYNKVAIEYDHLNSVCFKRRILPLEHESHKFSLNTFRYDSNTNANDFEILITQKVPTSLKELRKKLNGNYFLVYDNLLTITLIRLNRCPLTLHKKLHNLSQLSMHGMRKSHHHLKISLVTLLANCLFEFINV